MLFSNFLDHEFEETVLIRGGYGIVEIPVYFKLSVSIFVIVLIRPPA